jgi:hypothetical protein
MNLGLSLGLGGGARTLGQLFRLMASQQVDFVGVGDSNQVFNGTGWDHGFQKALIDLGYPMFATGLISCNENTGQGSGLGYGYNFSGATPDTIATTGAPTALNDILNPGTGGPHPHKYFYIPDASTFANGNGSGLTLIGTTNSIAVEAALDYSVWWGSFNAGSGSFGIAVRLDASPFTTLAQSATVSTNTGTEQLNKLSVSIAANPSRTQNLGCRLTRPGVDMVGPWVGFWQRATNTARTTGFSYSTLIFRGGQSARTAAVDLQQFSDATLTSYFGILRSEQLAANKVICITINKGLNDRNETLASVGPDAVADGDSPEAFVDNHKAIVERITGIWTLNGWPTSELYWLVFPSHPISDPDDAELLAYRSAIKTYFDTDVPNSEVINIQELTNTAEMLENSWYAGSGGSDRSHLTQAGYEQLSRRVMAATR